VSWSWWELSFPKDLDPKSVVSLMRTLAMRPRTGFFRRSDPVVFELVVCSEGVVWRIGTSEKLADWLVGQLRSTVPEVGARSTDFDRTNPDDALAIEVRVRSPRRPLRTDIPHTAASALLSSLNDLTKSETVTLSWLVGPWLPRHVPKPSNAAESGWYSDLADLVVEEQLDFRDARALDRKQVEAVFGCVGRMSATARTIERRRQLLQRVLGALQLVREPGAGFSRRVLPSWWIEPHLATMAHPKVSWPCPLNASELAELVMWPAEGVRAPNVSYLRQRLLAPDPSVFVDRAQVEHNGRVTRSVRVVAESTHPSVDGFLNLDPVSALQHLHVIGPTGSGKSTLMARLALQDIEAGRSVIVVEPKGDLIADLLDRIPEQRIDEVVLIDPTDPEHPVGLNVLTGNEPELVVDQVVHVLHSIYSAHWGPRSQDILHAGLLTLTRAGGYTLIDLPALLTDPGLRRLVVPKVQSDHTLAQFWGWFEALNDGDRAAAIGPVMNKLRSFTMRSAIRNMLGQAKPTFSFEAALQEKKVVLVNLAKGRLGPESAQLLGALIVSQLWQAVLGRSRLVADHRAPAMVFVDEFQDFLRLPTDLGDALAQARGLGVGLTLAHQHLGQLTPDVRSAVMSNARSRIAFQAADDAPALAKALGGGLTPDDLRDLEAFHAYASLVGQGSVTASASARTLPLPPNLHNADRVRARSRERYGRPVADIEAESERRRVGEKPEGPVGGRRRQS
jgi:hypothetical protein